MCVAEAEQKQRFQTLQPCRRGAEEDGVEEDEVEEEVVEEKGREGKGGEGRGKNIYKNKALETSSCMTERTDPLKELRGRKSDMRI